MKISEIKIGQIWKHSDGRSGERFLKVTKIQDNKVHCDVRGKNSRIKPTTCISEREMLQDKRFEFLGDNDSCVNIAAPVTADRAYQDEIDRVFAPICEKLKGDSFETSETPVGTPKLSAEDIAYEESLERDFGALRKWIKGTDMKS